MALQHATFDDNPQKPGYRARSAARKPEPYEAILRISTHFRTMKTLQSHAGPFRRHSVIFAPSKATNTTALTSTSCTGMASTPATKRRRLDTASATLSKPFVSPFKTPLKRPSIQTGTPATADTDSLPTVSPLNHPSSTIAQPNSKQTLSRHSPSPHNPTPTDAALLPLLKTHRALELRLRTLRTEIDTLSQAAQIEGSDSDAELVALIGKWKGASREAAEEVFGDVRDRVNRMGGVGAWREMGRRREEWRGGGWGFEDGGGRGRDEAEEGEVSEGERERRRAEVEDLMEGDGEGRGLRGGVVEDEDVDDDTFTMDMMLRSLNIDLNVIGFDKEIQRWVD